MYCKNCGHELKENAKFCTGCGQPITQAPQPQTNTTQNKKQTNPFKRLLKILLIIILAPVALAVLFFIGAIIAALIGRGSERAETNSNSAQTPIATIAATATPTVAPTIAPTATTEATPEITPEPETVPLILNYVGSYTAEFFKDYGITVKYGLPYDDCLCIYMYDNLSFEACKAIGIVGFMDLEDDLRSMYNTVISYIDEFEMMQDQEYEVIVAYMSNDGKQIMMYTENGIDYSIK